MKLPKLPADLPQCELTVLNAGHYYASLHLMKKGNEKQKIWGPALFYLIKHPKHGYILFDTGYSTRFFDAARSFPYSLMRLTLPVRISEEENAVNQLQAMGIAPDDVTVILSHMHVDHVGGIHDFPNSRIIVSKVEWAFTRHSAFKLLRNSYLKSLFDKINPNLVQLVDFDRAERYGPFAKAFDLFQDGTMILVPLPGHAIGQMGLILNCSAAERYFLIADAVYVQGNYRENKCGAWLSKIAHYDSKQYESHFPFLRALEQANSELLLLPSHDPDVYAKYVNREAYV
ncbi:MBL fold metallo-hydrolase [Paenibacillus sp. GCM10027626]|uniref:MBL fold metallo-hydrolase n=1 Tax=Paenibacillus sp. GCM10027626 TaxID=3273411 RepID=UPI0036400408